MALYDSADLLARCKLDAQRPAIDELMSDTSWYIYLQEAQTYWVPQIATHFPEVMYGPPELMTTADGGQTYTVSGYPLGHMEIRASRNGVVLLPGPEWDESSAFTQEGQIIRIPAGRSRVFPNGPYARYVKVPGLLDASNQPTLKPDFCRLLLVVRACYYYASRGGYRDPTPFEQKEQKLWSGDPNLAGDVGFLGALKAQYFGAGQAAVSQQADPAWWRGTPDLR